MDEMIEDTMEMMDDEELEEEAEEEVNNVLYQITDGMLGEAGTVGPVLERKPALEAEAEDEEEGPELDMMQKRLEVIISSLSSAMYMSIKLVYTNLPGTARLTWWTPTLYPSYT